MSCSLNLFIYFVVVEGLSVSEAGKLYNYLHVRRRFGKKQNSLIDRPKLNPSIDFMDSIEEDIPMGDSLTLSQI